MKRTFLAIFVIILTSVVALAQNPEIINFSAKSDSKIIIVEWQISSEKNVKSFELQRASGESEKASFKTIANIEAQNMSFYKYNDESAFMKKDGDDKYLENLYYYRLKIINDDNTYFYSDKISVTHSISSINRTWGMIKEMFR
ncbi:MAG: hypothetical protein ACOCZW_02275 [Bacteroidota bacterium]